MKIRTYKKWNKKGRYIFTGSKAIGFTKKGNPLFRKDQTYVPEAPEYNYTGGRREYTDAFGVDHSDAAGLPDGYSN